MEGKIRLKLGQILRDGLRFISKRSQFLSQWEVKKFFRKNRPIKSPKGVVVMMKMGEVKLGKVMCFFYRKEENF